MAARRFGLAAVSVSLAFGMASPGRAALVASYDFNEVGGTVAHPTVGAVNGTLQNGASFMSGGVEGGAVSMARGSPGGLVDFGNNLFPSGAFSVQLWVKTRDTAASLPLSFHTSSVVAGFFLGINNTGDGCSSSAGSAEFYVVYPCSGSSILVVNDGQWHQLVGVYDGNRSSIFVDGQFQSASSGGNPLTPPPATTDFLLGGVMLGTTPTNAYDGLVDKMLLYDSALSAADVNWLYLSAVPEPSTSALIESGLVALGFIARLRRSTRLQAEFELAPLRVRLSNSVLGPEPRVPADSRGGPRVPAFHLMQVGGRPVIPM